MGLRNQYRLRRFGKRLRLKCKQKKFARKLGFTIIEVMLFLAISALLFVSVINSAGSGIAQRRYDDTVSDFVEYLRRAYSDVENVQNSSGSRAERSYGCTIASNSGGNLQQSANISTSTGRTNCGIYGKILIFGQDGDGETVHSYDIIGDIIDLTHKLTSTDLLGALKETHAEFLAFEKNQNSTGCKVNFAGNADSHILQWGGQVENTLANHQIFRGAVIIVRSPVNATIHTYIIDQNSNADAFALQELMSQGYTCDDTGIQQARGRAEMSQVLLSELINDGNFQQSTADFCVYSEDVYAGRRNVRLHADSVNGTNSSAVELVEADSEENRCR